ncbi:C40 family peptidase [Bacillus massiliigorillae]|uniref:C40 family peptidase n=1 Tax=Bacillus massiliigorillae TaxID=1243664 RepID=UPI000399E730|nr:C40 family peptidase [Bacillus massiliigorillae]
MKKAILIGALASSLLFAGQALAADYTVKSGDSLWSISKANNVTVSQLKTWNQLKSDVIYPGQILKINTSSSKTYIVAKGDTFYKIAQKFNMSMSQLQSLNPQVQNINSLYIGQVLNISGNSSNSSNWESKANSIIESGKKYLGAKYLYGASPDRTDVFDCSSYTQRVFKENGITLPRTSIEQSKVGTAISLSEVRKGDLIFFDTDYDGVINHVAIAMDNTSLLQCTTSSGVSTATLNSYWKPRAVKAVRVIK